MLLSSYLYQVDSKDFTATSHFIHSYVLSLQDPVCSFTRKAFSSCKSWLFSVLHIYFSYIFFNLSYLGFMQSSIHKEQINKQKHYRKNNCASNWILVAKTTISLPPVANNGIRGNVSNAVHNSFCPMIFRYINFNWYINININ